MNHVLPEDPSMRHRSTGGCVRNNATFARRAGVCYSPATPNRLETVTLPHDAGANIMTIQEVRQHDRLRFARWDDDGRASVPAIVR